MNQNDDLRDLQLAGVVWELDDTPLVRRDTFLKTAAAPQSGATNTNMPTPTPGPAVVPPVAPVAHDSAEKIASTAMNIQALVAEIEKFEHPLRATATRVVAPHIAPNPNGLIILTDAPGADDDATGRILSGAAGELLDKMLGAIGMSRDNVSILPMIFWRAPGGRSPSRGELDLAHPFVTRAIELLAPRVILSMGTLPATEIGGVNLAKSHGVTTTLASGCVLMPIYHPNYLILKPAAKRDAWNALQQLQNLLKPL